jgi:GNAT superfamily N-acetyltransferase
MRVRHVLIAEHAALRDLRLAALESDPEAFGSTYERDAARPDHFWTSWAARSEEGTTERTFVLTDDASWIGLVHVRIDEPRKAELLAMWVAPEARRRGGARRLCEAAAMWAKERGCDELRLRVEVDNEQARSAYVATGFVAYAQTKSSHGERTLAVDLMSRPL